MPEIITEDADPTTEVRREAYVERPVRRVVEEPAPVYRQPASYVQQSHDPMINTIAASGLIQTIVWSIVVIVAVVVGILILLHYNII